VPRPKDAPKSIALASYPEAKLTDESVNRRMAILQAVIGAARTTRSEHDVKYAVKVPLSIRTDDDATRAFLESRRVSVEFLVNTSALTFEKTGGARAPGTTVSVVPSEAGAIEVLVNLKGLVTAEDERARIERELKRIDKDIAVIDKKLNAKGFVDRAPKEVVEEAQGQRRALLEARGRLEESRKLADELG
jgi:valyl-tRNA synthetase